MAAGFYGDDARDGLANGRIALKPPASSSTNHASALFRPRWSMRRTKNSAATSAATPSLPPFPAGPYCVDARGYRQKR
jgi:hypothetical protein